MKCLKILAFAILTLSSAKVFADNHQNCAAIIDPSRIPPELWWYQSIRNLVATPTRSFNDFTPMQAIFVTHRDAQGRPTDGFIRVLSDNPNNTIEVIGEFNNWGKNGTVHLHPDSDPRYMVGDLHGIWHGMQYRLVVNGQQLIDPAAMTLSTPEFNARMGRAPDRFLNPVFWDVAGVARYDFKNPRVPVGVNGGTYIHENDIFTLAAKWNFNGHTGPRTPQEMFSFIADSGLIQKIRSQGYNAVEFLPLTASVDGNVWAYRYLSYSIFALDSRWGTYTDFQRMVDTFHRYGISVILDFVPGHYANHGNLDVRSVAPIGMHNQHMTDGRAVYGDAPTEWGSNRFNNPSPYIRRYLKDGMLNFVKFGNIDGIRIDNFCGIQGLPGGNDFLRELVSEIRSYDPKFYINAESFGGDNTVTKCMDWGGYGASSHNNGDFFFGFIKGNAQKNPADIDLFVIENQLRDARRWNETATLNYVTNHDEAANGQGGATGAYFATLMGGGQDWLKVEGATRVWGAMAMLSGSFYIDMPQFRLMQEGTYYTNSPVDWSLENHSSQNRMEAFYSELGRYYTSNAAFAFHNTIQDVVNHVDNDNKVITFKRMDLQTGKVIYILFNAGNRTLENYRFGVYEGGAFHIALDSDNEKFGGTSRLGRATQGHLPSENVGEHGKPHSLNIPFLAPRSVTIFEQGG